MKNLRKLFTLALALMMLISVFTLPALAATVEHDHDHACETTSEIQPRYAIGPCLYCGGVTTYSGMQMIDGVRYTVAKCVECGKTSLFANP